MAKQNLTIVKPTEVTAPAPGFLKAHGGGRGVSHDAADNIVPLIYVLQALSPQVNKAKPDFIPGSEAGDIWMRNSVPPIVKGEAGLLFQPCYFYKDWIEWIPRAKGGGYQGRHDARPDDAKEKPDAENPKRSRWMRPNGNEVIETRYHAGFVLLPGGTAAPYLIPMSGSGHTVSRNWMFMMNQKTMGGEVVDSWAGTYRLKTVSKTNAAGTWYTWAITDAGWVATEADYKRGEALFNSFKSGDKVAEAPANVEADDDTM